MKPALAGVVAAVALVAAGMMWMASQPAGPPATTEQLADQTQSGEETNPNPEGTQSFLERLEEGRQTVNEPRYFVQDVKAAWSFFRTQVVSFPVPSRVIDAPTQIPSGA